LRGGATSARAAEEQRGMSARWLAVAAMLINVGSGLTTTALESRRPSITTGSSCSTATTTRPARLGLRPLETVACPLGYQVFNIV
jgi:hypothetical protein